MSLGAWVRYYQSAQRERTLNVISLEFSRTSMDSLVEPPSVVRFNAHEQMDGIIVCVVVYISGEAVRLGGACMAKKPQRPADRPHQ